MALWIQNRPARKSGLTGLQVAEHLAALPDDWVVRWGFCYEDNAGTTQEGDFLILGPGGGLLGLEAKGGGQLLAVIQTSDAAQLTNTQKENI
jgi:hypothetical protein